MRMRAARVLTQAFIGLGVGREIHEAPQQPILNDTIHIQPQEVHKHLNKINHIKRQCRIHNRYAAYHHVPQEQFFGYFDNNVISNKQTQLPVSTHEKKITKKQDPSLIPLSPLEQQQLDHVQQILHRVVTGDHVALLSMTRKFTTETSPSFITYATHIKFKNHPYEQQINCLVRDTVRVMGAQIYDELGRIKPELTKQNQEKINQAYAVVLTQLFDQKGWTIINDLADDTEYFKYCAQLGNELGHQDASFQLLKDFYQKVFYKDAAHNQQLVQKGLVQEINYKIKQMTHMPPKEALAFGEKHKIFDSYPWFRHYINSKLNKEKLDVHPQIDALTEQQESNIYLNQQRIERLVELADDYQQQIEKNPDLTQQMIERLRARQYTIEQMVNSTHFLMDPLQQVLIDQCNDLTIRIKGTSDHIVKSELGLLYAQAHLFVDLTKELAKKEQFVNAFMTLDMGYLIADTIDKVGPVLYSKQAGDIFKTAAQAYLQIPHAQRCVYAGAPIQCLEPLNQRIIPMERGARLAVKEFITELTNDLSHPIQACKDFADGMAHLIVKLGACIEHYAFNDVGDKSQAEILKRHNKKVLNSDNPDLQELEKLYDYQAHIQTKEQNIQEWKEFDKKVASAALNAPVTVAKYAYKCCTEVPTKEEKQTIETVVNVGVKTVLNMRKAQVIGSAITSAGNALAGQILEQANNLGNNPGTQALVTNIGTITETLNDVAAAETAGEVITTTTTAAVKFTEAGIPLSKLAMFKKGKNSGGSSKPKTVPNKFFDGVNRGWKDLEVPRDKHTILKNDPSFQKTNYTNQKATVYKKDKYFYCRDQKHKSAGAHLEVFNKRGKHVGTANPLTGIIDFNKAVPGRTLNLK